MNQVYRAAKIIAKSMAKTLLISNANSAAMWLFSSAEAEITTVIGAIMKQ